MEIPLGQPAVLVSVDRERMGRLGVPPSAVLDTLAMSRAGVDVGVVREGERVFPLRLRVGGETVLAAADIGRLPVVTRHGTMVPMSTLTTIEEQSTVIQVSREEMQRRLVVQGNVRGRDLVGFVKEAKPRIDALELPPGVRVEWGGQFQNFNRAKNRLLALVPVALLVISLMLLVMFKRVSYVLVTVASLPFALAGGVLGLVVRGLPFSIPAGVGFIALAGVSVCTGIVMTGNLAREPEDKPALHRVRDAALASLRARISTALIAAIGFVPAAIATGAGAEVQRPLATVVIFGLSVSMVLSLLALPAMLLLVTRGGGAAASVDEPGNHEGAHGDHGGEVEGPHVAARLGDNGVHEG
jgi:cobalt-zinc-cadmium resistance protein CzcA